MNLDYFLYDDIWDGWICQIIKNPGLQIMSLIFIGNNYSDVFIYVKSAGMRVCLNNVCIPDNINYYLHPEYNIMQTIRIEQPE